jgi:paraquat-inducible protein B
MSERISPTAIGIFVSGAIALVIAAVVIVAGGQMFRKPHLFVCMFEGDLNGLKVGAAVKFRGVQVGTVESIGLKLPPSQGTLRPGLRVMPLPVVIAIDAESVANQGGTGEALTRPGFEDMIQSGLRAQLDVDSLLTGQLYVDLNIHQGAPLNFRLIPGRGLREIPTIPTTLEAVQDKAMQAIAKFDEIDFKALVVSITNAANSFQQLASSPDLKATIVSLQDTSANLNKTVTAMREATVNANTKIGPLVDTLQTSSLEANATMKDIRESLNNLDSTLDPDAPLAVNLNAALNQLADTTRSVQQLTDYLQQNPSSVIRGRYVPAKDQGAR